MFKFSSESIFATSTGVLKDSYFKCRAVKISAKFCLDFSLALCICVLRYDLHLINVRVASHLQLNIAHCDKNTVPLILNTKPAAASVNSQHQTKASRAILSFFAHASIGLDVCLTNNSKNCYTFRNLFDILQVSILLLLYNGKSTILCRYSQ